jgi:hypothetical protein
MPVVINGDTGISPVTASGTSASVDGMTVGRGGGEVSTNTALGSGALATNSVGPQVVAVGYQAGNLSTAGYSTFIGYQAGVNQSTGDSNTFVGRGITANAASGATTGTQNTAMGNYALSSVTSGSYCVAIGPNALNANTTASNNTAVGYQAGYTNATGKYNTFLGHSAGYTSNNSATVGSNTFVGSLAGYAVTSGTNNNFFGGLDSSGGVAAGSAVTSGSKNTILGSYSGNQGGLDIRTASNYIVLSDGDGNVRGASNASGQWSFGQNGGVLSGANATAVEAFASSAGWAALVAFINDSTGAYTQLTWNKGTSGNNLFNAFYTEGTATIRGSIQYNRAGGVTVYNTTSDYRAKTVNGLVQNALAKVSLLKPSTGRMNGATQDIDFFVAHELQEVVPSAVSGEKDAVNEDNTPKYQMVDKSALIPLLTKAIQELKTIVDAQAARIATLESR